MPDNDTDQQGGARAPATSLGLGERLRSARKARALTVAQTAEALRLDEAAVVALEEGRFEAMGAPVFVRGHLKRYALLVGLSPETVLEAYRAAAPDSDAPPPIARPAAQADAVSIGPWVWWAVAAVVILGLLLALLGGDDEQAPAGLAPTGIAAPPGAPLAVPVPRGSAAQPAEATPPPAAAPPPDTAAPSTAGN